MSEESGQKIFWEKKILRWERARYAPWAALYPLSWTVRARLKCAAEVIFERAPPTWRLLELGCGSGLLAAKLSGVYRKYTGIDIAANAVELARTRVKNEGFTFLAADAGESPLGPADLTIFLGLTDWLSPRQLSALLARVNSPNILFSYSQVSSLNPYRLYRSFADRSRSRGRAFRARDYSEREIGDMLAAAGYSYGRVSPSNPLNPGVLVWSEKLR